MQVSLSEKFRGILLYTVGTLLLVGDALENSDAFLSHPSISLSSHITIILISTLFSFLLIIGIGNGHLRWTVDRSGAGKFRFKSIILYAVVIVVHIEWCIRKPVSTSITPCSSIAHNHHTNINPNIYISILQLVPSRVWDYHTG